MEARRIHTMDDFVAICSQMQPDNWGADNEMTSYEPERLKAFLEAGNHLILAKEGEKIVGAAVAHTLMHPSADGGSLYVHEIDTHPEYRRRGVATLLMEELFKLTKELGLAELWVAADSGNEAAHGLYKKFNPTGADDCTVYYYEANDER